MSFFHPVSHSLAQTAAVWVVGSKRGGGRWGRGAAIPWWVMTSQHLHRDRWASTLMFPNYHKWHSVSELPSCSLTPGVPGSSGGLTNLRQLSQPGCLWSSSTRTGFSAHSHMIPLSIILSLSCFNTHSLTSYWSPRGTACHWFLLFRGKWERYVLYVKFHDW